MNVREADILKIIMGDSFSSQRELSEISGYSLGVVNHSIHKLVEEGYLDEGYRPTIIAQQICSYNKPKNAIILAAGYGMRMIPINLTTPKALLNVKGETLIERTIKQLHEVGIYDITVVVGFMKECFDYLIDEYGIELVVNPHYSNKNNLFSLSLVVDKISNTYIIPSDLWCKKNPYDLYEMHSWYMVGDTIDGENGVKVNRKMELVKVKEGTTGNKMIGIAYLVEEDAVRLREKIKNCVDNEKKDEEFWEVCLFKDDKMVIPAKVVNNNSVIEINTYEQLRDFDSDSNHLQSNALDIVATVFQTTLENIVDISILKKGMTNRSFLFSVDKRIYIMRVPGEGTEHLIDRRQEVAVFRTIKGYNLCDDPVYINPDNGYKITKFLEGARCCNINCERDLERCMEKLRTFHSMKLTVEHTFDIFKQIEFYEELWGGQPSMYRDYSMTKNNVLSLKPFIDSLEKDWCLTHIDAVPDNFLFYQTDSGEEIQLTDWEYAGMQDPHVDIAMFCVYSLYNKKQVDKLIDIYFQGECDQRTRTKIYAYIAMCGLLWSNWCEFKAKLGVEFGEYSLRQYRFAKDYYQYVIKEIELEKK